MKTIVDLVEEQKEYLLGKDTAAKQAVESNIAPVEADPSSASRAYVVGEQLFLNDVLYDVISPISVEGAIVVGTNITAANKLSADIKSKIDDLYSKNQTLTNNVSGIYDVIGKTGSKNWLKLTDVITGADITTITDEGANINVKKATAASWARFAVKIDVQPNTDYIMSTHIDYVSGRARVAVRNADDSANIFESADIQSDSDFSRQFNTGANSQVVVRLFCTANTVETGEVNFENAMIRLATDADATFQPYAKTNRQLTEDSVDWDDLSEVGAVNFAKISLTSQTDGIYTYTVADGIITAVVASATSLAQKDIANAFVLKKGTYKLSGIVEGVYVDIQVVNTSDSSIIATITGNESNKYTRVFTLSSDTTVKMRFTWHSGVSAGTYVFKPMIAPVSYNGPYVPYAKSNRELTEENNIETGLLTGDVTFNSNNITKKNGIVTIFAAFVADKDYAGFTEFVNVPSGFRPINAYPMGILFNDSHGTCTSVTGFAAGKIQASGAITSGEYYRIVMTYIIA